MTVAANPLTPGVYRIDLPCELAPQFGNWRRAQKGKVHVLELENGPARLGSSDPTARVSFVVFNRPGAFPFGRLGRPVAGQIVGELPGWGDVVAFVFAPLGAAEGALGQKMGEFLAAHTQPEFAALHEAVAVVQANMAVIRAELVAVRNGAPNGPAVLHHAAQLVGQSIELLVQRAGAIPGAFPRVVINEALAKLNELADAIAAAPGKALHAISQFPGKVWDSWLKPFVLPAEIGLGGVGLLLLGGYLVYSQGGKMTPTTKNLMLAGGAIAVLGGATLATNIADTLERTIPK
jgi:hypothetical protein